LDFCGYNATAAKQKKLWHSAAKKEVFAPAVAANAWQNPQRS
jgi:hypothetical protein